MADDPHKHGNAPQHERYDAQAKLSKSVGSLRDQLLPPDELRPVIDHIQHDLEEQAMLSKGRPNVIPFPRDKQRHGRGMQSVYLDDLQIFATGEYFEKPSPLAFDSMRQMVEQTPILNAVIMTRIRQITRFCRPQETKDAPGFEICHIDPDHKLTEQEQESQRLLTRFVSNCGWEFNPRRRQRLKRDSFSAFASKLVRDSLTMDSAAIETEMKRDRSKGIDGFYAIDGGTIRLCSEQGYHGDDEKFAVQVVNGQIRTVYGYDDLIYVPRNPRTNVRLAGYGLAETELLIRVVTGFLNAMTHNIKGFDDNAIPKGIMHLTGEYSPEDMNAFKRYWNAQVKGINNAWTVPVMTATDPEAKASFENLGVEFNEMYFSKWMTFLTSIVCAVYSMSPDEINFESFSAQQSSMSGRDTGEKLASSKDKGLRPMMAYMESLISDYIISDFSDKFVFRFRGLDVDDADQQFESRKLTLTLNEMRAQDGRDPWPDDGSGLGEAPVNPSLLSTWQQAQQGGQAQGEGQDEGQEDFGQVADAGESDQPADPGEPDSGDAQPAEDAGGSEDGQADGTTDKQPDFGASAGGGDFGKSVTIYSVE